MPPGYLCLSDLLQLLYLPLLELFWDFAGYFGSIIDNVIMRITDTIMHFLIFCWCRGGAIWADCEYYSYSWLWDWRGSRINA